MTSSEEKKRRKKEKAEKLRQKQEEALKRAHEEEQNAEIEKQKEESPDELAAKGYIISSDELSSGQFSTVFKAKLNDEDVVARVVQKQGKEESFLKKLVPRFVRILRILDERHPNIISTLDVFETSKKVIILMRPTINGSLYDFIDKQTDPTEESECRKWCQQLISAVSYLHINGIVHRDLRTERILLDENKSLKISGFTYSRLWMNVKKNTTELSNTCVGTGPYCAPETLTGESYDPRTADVWAFGVIVFYIWNKSYPFDYNMTHKLLAQHKSNEWINRIRSESNDHIKELFRKTFTVNHSQRPTIVDLLKDQWIDAKITVILDEELKALDYNSKTKSDTNSNTTEDKSKASDETYKPKTATDKTDTKKQISKENQSSQQKEDCLKPKEEVTQEKNETKPEQKDDKNTSNVVRNESKTKNNTNNENDSKEDTEDKEDVDVEEDDDDDNGSNEKSDPNTKPQEMKPKSENEKWRQIKSSVANIKNSVSDGNVLRPDILEQLKKEFLALD